MSDISTMKPSAAVLGLARAFTHRRVHTHMTNLSPDGPEVLEWRFPVPAENL